LNSVPAAVTAQTGNISICLMVAGGIRSGIEVSRQFQMPCIPRHVNSACFVHRTAQPSLLPGPLRVQFRLLHFAGGRLVASKRVNSAATGKDSSTERARSASA
jgi:hypothetical protein